MISAEAVTGIRDALVRELQFTVEYAGNTVIDAALEAVAAVRVTDDHAAYVVEAVTAAKVAIDRAFAPVLERLRSEAVAQRARADELELAAQAFDRFVRMITSETIH
jgi:hypothetical protein